MNTQTTEKSENIKTMIMKCISVSQNESKKRISAIWLKCATCCQMQVEVHTQFAKQLITCAKVLAHIASKESPE